MLKLSSGCQPTRCLTVSLLQIGLLRSECQACLTLTPRSMKTAGVLPPPKLTLEGLTPEKALMSSDCSNGSVEKGSTGEVAGNARSARDDLLRECVSLLDSVTFVVLAIVEVLLSAIPTTLAFFRWVESIGRCGARAVAMKLRN